MNITLTNNDDVLPVITRLMRLNAENEELDCISEMQLLPEQSADFAVGEGQSLVVFAR